MVELLYLDAHFSLVMSIVDKIRWTIIDPMEYKGWEWLGNEDNIYLLQQQS